MHVRWLSSNTWSQRLGDIDRAALYYDEAYAIYLKVLGPEHRSTMTAAFNLGTALTSQPENYTRAINLLKDLIDVTGKYMESVDEEVYCALLARSRTKPLYAPPGPKVLWRDVSPREQANHVDVHQYEGDGGGRGLCDLRTRAFFLTCRPRSFTAGTASSVSSRCLTRTTCTLLLPSTIWALCTTKPITLTRQSMRRRSFFGTNILLG